jgi:hypothetical protein
MKDSDRILDDAKDSIELRTRSVPCLQQRSAPDCGYYAKFFLDILDVEWKSITVSMKAGQMPAVTALTDRAAYNTFYDEHAIAGNSASSSSSSSLSLSSPAATNLREDQIRAIGDGGKQVIVSIDAATNAIMSGVPDADATLIANKLHTKGYASFVCNNTHSASRGEHWLAVHVTRIQGIHHFAFLDSLYKGRHSQHHNLARRLDALLQIYSTVPSEEKLLQLAAHAKLEDHILSTLPDNPTFFSFWSSVCRFCVQTNSGSTYMGMRVPLSLLSDAKTQWTAHGLSTDQSVVFSDNKSSIYFACLSDTTKHRFFTTIIWPRLQANILSIQQHHLSAPVLTFITEHLSSRPNSWKLDKLSSSLNTLRDLCTQSRNAMLKSASSKRPATPPPQSTQHKNTAPPSPPTTFKRHKH